MAELGNLTVGYCALSLANVNCENPRRKPVSHPFRPVLGHHGGFRDRGNSFSSSIHRTLQSCTGCTQFAEHSGLRRRYSKVQSQRRLASKDDVDVIKAPAEVCPICSGTGWKTVSAAPNAISPNDRRVTRCDCQLRARANSLLTAARIPRRYEHCELSNFEFDGPHRSLAPARMAACRFVEEYPLEKSGLLFVGNTGRGKTHLAVGIAKALIREKGVDCIFYDYSELLKHIQDSYNPSVEATELGLLRPVFEAEVLVLDDLGSVRPTEWRWDTVRLILNTRYNENRTTIITTNFADEPAAATVSDDTRKSESYAAARAASREDTLGDRIGETMRSRLHEMCRVVRVDGDDFREKFRNASLGQPTGLIRDEIAVACANCPHCGKDNVYKRVGNIRTNLRSTLRVAITCKGCGASLSVAKSDLQIRKKTRQALEAEYSIAALEWME